jgi:hypothetical protein
MNHITISPIVEGHGEVAAVPLLIHKIAKEIQLDTALTVKPPLRVHADQLRRAGELERHIENRTRRFGRQVKILILLDCDWGGCCPKQEGPALLSRAKRHAPDVSISLVLAHREFESWFIASAASLRGKFGISEEMPLLDDPESIRGAKEWLRRYMPRNHPYAETDDQIVFTRALDINLAKRAPSFDKFYREVVTLLHE